MTEQMLEAFHIGEPHVSSAALYRIFLLRYDHIWEAVGERVNPLAEDLRRLRINSEAENVLWRVLSGKLHFEKAVVLQLIKVCRAGEGQMTKSCLKTCAQNKPCKQRVRKR